MPPPCHSHNPPARRATRPQHQNSGVAKRVYVRSRGAAMSALSRVVAADQASLTRSPKQPSRPPLVGPSARSNTPSSADVTPTPGAGEEFFPPDTMSCSNTPPTPGLLTDNLGDLARVVTIAETASAPTPATAPTPAPDATPPAYAYAEEKQPMPQRPKKAAAPAPRFPAPQTIVAPDRFPSPPQMEERRALFTTPPFSLPATTRGSPMEVVGPTYATITKASTIAGIGTPALATTITAASAPAAVPAADKKQPTTRYPPLVVEMFPKWPTHFRELKTLLGHAPNGRPFGKGVRFIPKSEQEYRTIQRYLYALETKEKISWFSYSLPAERSLKVAIRGLPVNTPPEEIVAELTELGFTPEFVRPIRARQGRPGCLFFAQLARTANVTPALYEINELLCMPGVHIEAWRGKKGPAQCHRCQQFRHSSHNCHRPLSCVRCGGAHAARDCPRPLEEPPTCANCGGAHTANSSACPVFKREIRNRKAGTIARTLTATSQQSEKPSIVEEGNAPTSLMAVANPPQQRARRKRRNKKKTQAEQGDAPSNNIQEVTVVAAPQEGTKAKRIVQPKPAPKPATVDRDPRLTSVIGTLQKVLVALLEKRDPVPLILECLSELCKSGTV